MAVPRILYKAQWNELDELQHTYLITWNPKPRFYNYDKYGDNDYTTQWLSMCEVLHGFDRCSDNYAFVAEVSDSGKLHMHGFYTLKDKFKFCKSVYPKLTKHGFVKLSEVKSFKWKTFKYHVKDLEVTKQFINRDRVEIVMTPETMQAAIAELQDVRAFAASKVKRFTIEDYF